MRLLFLALMMTVATLAAEPLVIPLWPEGVPAHADTLGYVKPRRSTEIASSPWGIQAGDSERVTLFDRAGELGVKWTRFLAVWPQIEKEKGRYDFTSVDEPVDAAGRTASLRSSVSPTATNSIRRPSPIPIRTGG